MTRPQHQQAPPAYEGALPALSPIPGRQDQSLNAAGWRRAICAVAAALALALILLFALLPEPLAAHAVKSGSAFSATTSDTCTLPRLEVRGTAQHVLDKGGGPPDACRHAAPALRRTDPGADIVEATGRDLRLNLPAQGHAAHTAEPRAPPRA